MFFNRLIAKGSITQKGVALLFFTFVAQMTGTSILQGILVVYVSKQFHFSDSQAYLLFASFTAVTYSAAIFGGYLGGRFVSHFMAAVIGLLLAAVGVFIVGQKSLLLLNVGIAIYAIGVGLYSPNAYYLLGKLYPKNNAKRDSGFVLIYMAMNVGALIGFWAAGYLSFEHGGHLVFYLGSVIEFLGALVLLMNAALFKTFKNDQATKFFRFFVLLIVGIVVAMILIEFRVLSRLLLLSLGVLMLAYVLKLGLRREGRKRKKILTFFVLLFFSIAFWSIYGLRLSVLILFLDRNVSKVILGYHIPTSSVMMLDPIYLIVISMITVFWLKHKKRTLAVTSKFSLALILIGSSLIVVAVGILFESSVGMISLYWILAMLLCISFAEICIGPTAYAMVGLYIEDENLQSVMLGVSRLMVGLGALISSYIANFASAKGTVLTPLVSNKTYQVYFVSLGVLTVFIGIFLKIFQRNFLKSDG